MARKYDIYDEYGRKIGTAEKQPTAAEQAAGCLLLLYLLRPLYPFLAAIGIIVGMIYAIFAGISWVGNFTKDTFTPYDSIKIEARGKSGSKENWTTWTVLYTIHNQSSQAMDLDLAVKLPVRFYGCSGVRDVVVNFQKYSYQPAIIQYHLEPNEIESGTIDVEYDEDGRNAAYYVCREVLGGLKTVGCDFYRCQQYEILTPRFFVLRKIQDPLELKVNALLP